jgi:putative ABC transport system permease protein
VLFASGEIRRAKLRFSLLAGAVGLLVFLILFQQVLLGSLLQSFTGALENQSATILVYGAEARKNVEGSIVPPDAIPAIAAVDGVARAVPLGEGTFTMDAGGSQVDAAVFGYTPGGPGEPTNVVAGRLPERPGEAVAPSEDKAKGFDIGQTVTSAAGDPPVPVTIVGLTERSRFSVAPTLFTHFATYEQLRRAANPDARGVLPTLVAVETDPGADAAAVATAIDDAVPGVEALTRQRAVSEAPGVAAVQQSFSLILLLAFVVVTLVVGFFFLILTVQKSSSLTLLRAVGAPSGYLVRSLLLQILLVVGGGLAVGVVLLLGAAAGAQSGLPLTIEPATVIATCVAVVVFGLLASSVAVVRVLRIDPFSVVSRQSLGGTA